MLLCEAHSISLQMNATSVLAVWVSKAVSSIGMGNAAPLERMIGAPAAARRDFFHAPVRALA